MLLLGGGPFLPPTWAFKVMELVLYVCVCWVCGTYVVHHCNSTSTKLHCEDWPALCTQYMDVALACEKSAIQGINWPRPKNILSEVFIHSCLIPSTFPWCEWNDQASVFVPLNDNSPLWLPAWQIDIDWCNEKTPDRRKSYEPFFYFCLPTLSLSVWSTGQNWVLEFAFLQIKLFLSCTIQLPHGSCKEIIPDRP